MHARQPERRLDTRTAVTSVRRFSGALADELYVACRPAPGVTGVARQAEVAYEALFDGLAAEGVGPEAIVTETVFLRGVGDHHEAAAARSRVLGETVPLLQHPATTFIGQPPLAEHAHLEISAVAVVPRPTVPSSVHEVHRAAACACPVCASGMRARIVRIGDRTTLHAANVYGVGRDAFEEASAMFCAAERLLAESEMDFRDVVRTWIHVRDIDRDYDALNRARREFLRHCGIERRPASTGVEGTPVADAHNFSLSFTAIRTVRPLDVTAISTPSLNEAWTYGADFSRGLRVADDNQVTLHVSGTASIDEAGRTVHVGDLEAQAERMLHNIATLLAGQGATFEDLVSGVLYLKRPSDAPALHAAFRRRGFEGFPCALVAAKLCRPDLLCEAEAVALLPPGPTRA